MMQKLKNIYHLGQAMAANILYGFPARKLTVVGVTGTDGKTTTASLIYHILKTAGKRVALISTVGAWIGDTVFDVGFHVTNPATFALQKFIRQIADEGNKYLVLEVTSHGIDQNRVWGIPFRIGVLTNITREHLDYHGTFEHYARTKFRLLRTADAAILNRDDESWRLFRSRREQKDGNDQRVITYAKLDRGADLTPRKFPFETKLIGEFNISNCLAAIAAARELGVGDAVIRKAVASFAAPVGRQEIVYDKDFRVMVDFAHTPNGFAQMLPAVRKMTKGRLIHVWGAAGKRDKSKRPVMGAESAKYADIIILTAEDPRDETVEGIAEEIVTGFPDGWVKRDRMTGEMDEKPDERESKKSKVKSQKTFSIISSRKEAIGFAISMAKKGDTVVCTGKSHEKSINYGHGEEPWDEFSVIREAVNGV